MTQARQSKLPPTPPPGVSGRIRESFRVSDLPPPSSPLARRSGFTLMEMLLALAVSAIVLAGIGGVFYSAIRLRERTAALVDAAAPLHQALAFLRRDLLGVMPPGGVLAGDFRVGAISSGMAQAYGIQFSTTTGIIRDDVPWGDIQDVAYELRDPVERNYAGGKDLIRSVTRNLLPTATQDAEEQRLLGNIQSLQVACFDGTDWRDTWDSSLGDTNLPVAIRVRIQLATDNAGDARDRQPIEMIVPLTTQSRTNAIQTTEGGA
ncbi:MAG: type II secretion system protein GspJ [Verrucomicrobiota bacterium]